MKLYICFPKGSWRPSTPYNYCHAIWLSYINCPSIPHANRFSTHYIDYICSPSTYSTDFPSIHYINSPPIYYIESPSTHYTTSWIDTHHRRCCWWGYSTAASDNTRHCLLHLLWERIWLLWQAPGRYQRAVQIHQEEEIRTYKLCYSEQGIYSTSTGCRSR